MMKIIIVMIVKWNDHEVKIVLDELKFSRNTLKVVVHKIILFEMKNGIISKSQYIRNIYSDNWRKDSKSQALPPVFDF